MREEIFENYCENCGLNWKSTYLVEKKALCPDCQSYDNQEFIKEINIKDMEDEAKEERERVLSIFKDNKVFTFKVFSWRENHKKIRFKGRTLIVIKEKRQRRD